MALEISGPFICALREKSLVLARLSAVFRSKSRANASLYLRAILPCGVGRIVFGNVTRAIFSGLTPTAFAHASAFAQSTTPLPKSKPTYSELLAAAAPANWRPLDLENTLYMDLPTGRVLIELSAAYAPAHAANIRALVREGYFDGLSILRSQDNYVAQ